MEENNFIIDLIASLKRTQSQKQVKEDIKNLGDIKIPLIGTLNKSKTKSQIKQDLSSLNGTVNLVGKVDNKRVTASMKQATAQAQKQIDSKPVEMAFSVKKEKLLNDIKLLAQQNSRLFKDTDMSIKYNSLLDNAEMAKNSVELSTLRTQLGSLRSELKVTGNAGMTMTDALKNGLAKVLQLFGSSGIIMQFSKQLRNAWTEAKELDKAMTDLSRVNAAITREGFPDYLDRIISKTKQLAVATKDYIDSVTTFSRAGYNLADSEALADMAVQLEKVGDMDSVSASKSLLSGLQAYAQIDGYGMDQLAEKAQALNDKIDIIGNTASISQKEVAEGIQAVGSVMSDANTSVDEFLSLLAAGNRSVQDSNKVALAIRTSALRIRGCTAELQEMGETTDDVIESTSTLAEKIKALTNINGSGGVNILEADEETFRSIYDIYNDIAKVYDKMSDKDASALLDLIAGKNRSNQVSAILQNMSEANELLERSLNAAGTASEEYEIYLNSAEAASERFGVAMTEAYSSIINGETVKGLTNSAAAVLDFANSWNILEGTLRGFLALGILKGVTTLTVAFKNSAVQISNYGAALDSVKKVSIYAQDTIDYTKALNTLKNSCVNLTDAQLKQVLANRNLEKSQLIEILQLDTLEEEQVQARLSQLGLTEATVEQTVANGMATASTFSLKAAIIGLGTSIKTAIMANPVTFAIMAISTAIGVATSLISKYNQQLEETRQKNIEAATTASQNADKLKDLYTEYNRLASIQDKTTSDEEAFKTVIEDITVALGNKTKALENLTAGTDEYAAALERVTKEELQSQAVTATIGRKSAEEEFQSNIWNDWKGSKVSINSNSKGKSLSSEAQKAVAIVSDSLKEFETINRKWGNISWDISSSDPEEALSFYNALVEAREKLVSASGDDEALLDTEIYEDLNTAINTMSESLDTYIEKLYEEEKLNYMAQNGIPRITEEYKAMEAALTDAAGSSVDLQDKFKELLTADFTSLATGIEEVGEAINSTLNDENLIFSAFENTDFGTRIQHITDLFNDGTISHKEYFDALQSEIDNFDVSNFTDSIEDMDKASAQFFVDSMQQTADGLSTLINSFDKGEMSISEYLEGYLAIGNTLSKLTDDLQENSAAWNENGEAISEIGNTALDDTQNKLNSAMSVIESYQDSIYSLEQIMNDAVTVGTDEFTAHANVIAEDLYRIIQTGGEMADTIANTLGTTTSEIAQSLTENVSNQEIACQAIMANTNNAITDMASSIGELFDTLGDAISNFKVDLSFGVKSIDWKKVNVLGAELSLPEIKFELGASGESLDKIGSALSSFGKTIASNYTPQTIDLEDFHFGSTDAAKDRDYSPSSGITKNYNDALNKIKDSAKEASKSASKAAKDSTDDIKNEFEEMVDFFDRRKDVLNDALSLLKTNLDNVTGSFAKNKLIDAELGVTEEKFKNYSDALNMYTQKANEALSKLPSDIAAKVKDGAVDLTTFIGDGNKEVVEAIKDYENWADKVAECRQQLAELREAIRQLELQKFENIMEEFSNQFDLREDGKDLISKQIDLLKEAGQLIGESFFTTQIDQSKKQLALLEAEKTKLVEQMTSAIGSGRVQKGTTEWLSMVNSLSGVESEILDCKKALEELDNSILSLHTEIFERIQNQFSDLDSEISNIIGLFDDFEVSDDKGIWSKEAIAQLGLLSQQYELAQHRVQQYNDEIDELNAQYLAGKFSATEYADKLADLNSEQWNCVKSADSALSSIMDLNEARVNNAVKGIEKEVSAYKELIDAQIDSLAQEKALHDYKSSIADKTSEAEKLQREIAAMQNDTSSSTIARRKLKEQELADILSELEEMEYQNSIEAQKNALNAQYEQYEKERNDEITALRESLSDKENIIAASFETVKANADLVGQEIAYIATQHGITVSDAIITSWQNGEQAIASYGDVLSAGTSAFIGNIMGVENEVYNLQSKANETADSLAWMFSTRADNLVNELASSYYSEDNLNYMTQALHDSLVNTLEGGYNISSIQSALDGIASGLNNVASAANNATSAIAAMGAAQASAAQQTASNNTGKATSGYSIHQVGAVDPTYTVRNGRGDIVSSGNTLKEAQDYLKSKHVNGYASGTRNAKGNIRIVDEEGKELELPKLQSGRYAIGNEGDQILTKEQTDRIYEWSKLTPDELMMKLWKDNPDMGIIEPKVGRIHQPEIISSSVNNNSVNVHYDSVVQVNGDVNDANRIVKQIESVADKAIKKSWHDFEMTRKYGSY